MQARVNVLTLCCTLFVLQSAFAIAANADETESDWIPRTSEQSGGTRWVPSLAVVSGLTVQKWDGDTSATCLGCDLPANIPTALRPSESGNHADVTPSVGGQFQLMTPELPIPTRPRFFIGGDVGAAFGTDRILAHEGNVGRIRSPLPAASQGSVPFDENGALGQGSEVRAQFQTLLLGAEAGIAFPLKFLDRQFRVKPSVGWIRYQLEINGAVSDAECRIVGGTPPTNCNPNVLPGPGVLRAIELSATDHGTFDGVGGGLDLEMDVIRLGPFGGSLFIGGQVFDVLGPRKLEAHDGASFPNSGFPGLGAATTSADWRVEVNEVLFRAGLGVRLSWLGSD